MSQLSPSEVEWLSLIKYQTLVAREQAKLSQPINALALNSMQDAVESALALVVQARGGDLKSRSDFIQIFDAAISHANDPSALRMFRPSLSAMNTARVGFKHHGNVPDATVINRHLERSIEFIEQLAVEIFAVSMDDVSLLTFLRSEDAQEFLREAQSLARSADYAKAMGNLRLGFDAIVSDFTSRKVLYPGESIFSTKPSFYPNVFDLRRLGKEIEKIDEWLQRLDKWVRYSSLGINMVHYAYFDAHAPQVVYTTGGKALVHERDGQVYDTEVFARSFKFVVDTGISLARDDFDFDAWAARRASESVIVNDEQIEES